MMKSSNIEEVSKLKEYRGIKLADSVKLYNKDGSLNKQITKALDRLANILEARGHTLTTTYTRMQDLGKIDFKCGHKPQKVILGEYNNTTECHECFLARRGKPKRFKVNVNAYKHEGAWKEFVSDLWGAGYHDGKNNLEKYLPEGLEQHLIDAYNEGFVAGQELYTFHYISGAVKAKPVTNLGFEQMTDRDWKAARDEAARNGYIPNDSNIKKGGGCATILLIVFIATVLSKVIF